MSLFALAIVPVIGATPVAIPSLQYPPPSLSVEPTFLATASTGSGLRTFATRAEGGGGITGGAIAGILVAILALALIILFIFLRKRRSLPLPQPMVIPTYSPPPYASPQLKPKPNAYPVTPAYPTLPAYTGPATATAYVGKGGVAYPAAVHPAPGGYYATRQTRGVKWGGVGVRNY